MSVLWDRAEELFATLRPPTREWFAVSGDLDDFIFYDPNEYLPDSDWGR